MLSSRLLSKLEGELQLAVVDALQDRRCLKRIIDPEVQVALDEQLLAQKGHEIR
jgi:hypothetical protein